MWSQLLLSHSCSGMSKAPTENQRCGQGCKYIKHSRKGMRFGRFASAMFEALTTAQQPLSSFQVSLEVSPPLPAAAQTGSQEQLRCCEPPPHPPSSEQPSLNSAEQKSSNSGQAISSLKEPEPAESFGKVQNLLAVTLDVKL